MSTPLELGDPVTVCSALLGIPPTACSFVRESFDGILVRSVSGDLAPAS